MRRPLVQFLYLLYCVQAGVFLLLSPWSAIWVNSYFAQAPILRSILTCGYVRGAVSSVGLLLLLVGTRDLVTFCRMLRES